MTFYLILQRASFRVSDRTRIQVGHKTSGCCRVVRPVISLRRGKRPSPCKIAAIPWWNNLKVPWISGISWISWITLDKKSTYSTAASTSPKITLFIDINHQYVLWLWNGNPYVLRMSVRFNCSTNQKVNRRHGMLPSSVTVLCLVGGFKHIFIFHFIYGMSSFPLTNSYFSIWLLHHQPDVHSWDVTYPPITLQSNHCICGWTAQPASNLP